MNLPALAMGHRQRSLSLVWMLAGLAVSAGCLPLNFAPSGLTTPLRPRSTTTADVAAFVIYPETTPLAAPSPPPIHAVSPALSATLANGHNGAGADPSGAKTAALVTLRNFVDAGGPYWGAWWFEADEQGDLDEILAVIFFAEGSTSLEVRQAIAARFLWYCGGKGERCQGQALINFLAYFQGWREPWMVESGFTNAAARAYLALADDVIHQRGLVVEWVPGAEWFAQNPSALEEAGPVDWEATLFHFANVHSTWDAYLRQALGRTPNGPNRLWVLTVGEARSVCLDGFVCPDMTQARP